MKTIYRESKEGKALIEAVGDPNRITVAAEAIESKMEAVTKAAEAAGIPVLYAGGDAAKVMESGAESFLIGLVVQQVKGKDGKTESHYKAVSVFPFYSVEQIMEADNGPDFLAKIAEKEIAHVGFRPLRNAENDSELEAAAKLVPVNLDGFLAARQRGDKIDLTALQLLWPLYHEMFSEAVNPETGEIDAVAKAKRAAIAYAPSPRATQQAAKMFRSASWASEHFEVLESRGIVVTMLQDLIALCEQELPLGEPEDGSDEPTMITIDSSVLQVWLDNRDETDINPIVQRAEVDITALDAFVSS